MKESNEIFNLFLIFSNTKEKLAFSFNFFARDAVYKVFGGKFLKSLVQIFAEIVARGNAVQIAPNFPAKSLSIYAKKFLRHLFN